MPELDEDFIAHAASVIGRAHPQLLPVDNGKLRQAFQLFGKRPQPFVNAPGAVLNPLHLPLPGFEADVARLAAEQRAQDERAMEATYLALRPLERAVLWRMLEQQDRFRPYDADALAFYREKSGEKATPPKVQNAIDSLRALSPALIWKSAKGDYALDDADMHKWLQMRTAAGHWPPVPPAGLVIEDN